MTCVWRPRPASSLPRFLAALLLAVGAGLWAGPAGAAPGTVLLVATETGRAEREQLASWLGLDQRWLRSLRVEEAALRWDWPDTSGPRLHELLAALQSAAGDSVPGLLTVESRLRERWLQRGRLSATVSASGDTLQVNPGPEWTVGVWEVTGDGFPGRDHLISTWLPRAGDALRPAELVRGIDRVLSGCGEAGFPFARWVTRSVQLDPGTQTVGIQALLLPGQRAWLGPITSDLQAPRARRFLARSSGLRAGDVFADSELRRARDRLLARDLYTGVGEPLVYLTSAVDTVGVHFPVTARRKVNRVQVVLGLSRREEGGSRLSGEVDLRLPNLAGSGRKLQVGWRDDGADRSRFGFSYREPLAFGTGLDMGLALDNEVATDAYTRFRLDNTWSLPVVALWAVELGLGWDRATYPRGALERTGRVRASGALEHRRGDRTRSGWEGLFAIETAWRSADFRSDGAEAGLGNSRLGQAVTQRIFRVDAAGEVMALPTLSVFGRGSVRQLTGGEKDVPLSEQFRFGGAATLRGYREDEFSGSRAAWGSLELRIGRPEGSRLYTFYDVGYFGFWIPDPLSAGDDLLQREGWRRGYGLGLFARTPGGDVSLAIGFPGTVDFDQAKLHVTLLETF